MKNLLFIISIVLLSGCSSYQTVSIDTLNAPAHPISPNIKKIVLLNNSEEQPANIGHTTYKQKATYSVTTTKKKVHSLEIKVDSTCTTALYSMSNQLNTSLLLDYVSIGRKSASPHITTYSAKHVLNQYQADALLVLEELAYEDNLTHTYYEYFEVSEDEIEVSTHSKWNLYYANNQSPYTFIMNDTLYWNDGELNRADCVLEAVWNNAEKSTKNIIPYWSTASRVYYTKNSLIYKEISEHINRGDWEAAAKIWISLYKAEKKDNNFKGRMAFNMSVFFETQNDIETALEWLGIANKIFVEKSSATDLNLCSQYIVILDARLKNEEKLNEQFNR